LNLPFDGKNIRKVHGKNRGKVNGTKRALMDEGELIKVLNRTED
jgi:hypothetical protein